MAACWLLSLLTSALLPFLVWSSSGCCSWCRQQGCYSFSASQNMYATLDYNMLTSPCYPGTYPPGSLCEWRIRADPGYVVELHFNSLEMESSNKCIYDSVTLYDGAHTSSPRLATLCSTSYYIRHRLYCSTGRDMLVQFMSDDTYNYKGFDIRYRQIPPDQTQLCYRPASTPYFPSHFDTTHPPPTRHPSVSKTSYPNTVWRYHYLTATPRHRPRHPDNQGGGGSEGWATTNGAILGGIAVVVIVLIIAITVLACFCHRKKLCRSGPPIDSVALTRPTSGGMTDPRSERTSAYALSNPALATSPVFNYSPHVTGGNYARQPRPSGTSRLREILNFSNSEASHGTNTPLYPSRTSPNSSWPFSVASAFPSAPAYNDEPPAYSETSNSSVELRGEADVPSEPPPSYSEVMMSSRPFAEAGAGRSVSFHSEM